MTYHRFASIRSLKFCHLLLQLLVFALKKEDIRKKVCRSLHKILPLHIFSTQYFCHTIFLSLHIFYPKLTISAFRSDWKAISFFLFSTVNVAMACFSDSNWSTGFKDDSLGFSSLPSSCNSLLSDDL